MPADAYTAAFQGIADLENDESVGFQLISTDDIDDYGVAAIIKRIRERVGDSPVYLRYGNSTAPANVYGG